MFTEIYTQAKLRELSDPRLAAEARRRHADPDAEVPRTGVGRVHEVFRRIADGEAPPPPRAQRWGIAP